MAAALAVRGLAVADPRAAFEAGGDPLSLHFARDGHWSERGHRVAAEGVALRLPPLQATGDPSRER